MSKTTVPDLLSKKQNGQKITCLTAYDAPTAQMLDEAGIDLVLVGDTLGNVILGHDNTLPVTISDMVHHTKAVKRGLKNAFLAADMPLSSFVSEGLALADADLLIEAGAEAVKIEGIRHVNIIRELVRNNIPVIGHIGFLPQSIGTDGGPAVKGKTSEEAESLMSAARLLESAGVFSMVLELVKPDIAKRITSSVGIPTIGIGSGPYCDGQILVVNDMLGLTCGKVPRFVKKYADLKDVVVDAAKKYAQEVRGLKFPSA